ncbi:MAG: copper resistance system multicopper oxidase [Rhodospirillales bacterium]|nr:copper resistance system multicopper oxidase [Rhodospirillales bacterium]
MRNDVPRCQQRPGDTGAGRRHGRPRSRQGPRPRGSPALVRSLRGGHDGRRRCKPVTRGRRAGSSRPAAFGAKGEIVRDPAPLTRRQLLGTTAAAGALLGAQALLPAWARNVAGSRPVAGPRTGPHEFDLTIAETPIAIDGRRGSAITLNGGFPGPVMRFQEGETVTIRVHNRLDEDTSIHWHGILLPFRMDGVPGVSFPGIRAGETFTYRYPVRQSGTYWYHSHKGLQEQLGHYGPLIIDPLKPDPVAFDREHIVVLSDWMFEDPYRVFAKLKKHSDYLNFQKRTVGDFFADVAAAGLGATVRDRLAWGEMKMDPTDIADITGHIYTYLINGHGPEDNWTGLFNPGERVRLRVINASTMSYFNVRIPGLPLTVVEADGQPVRPVTVGEFQIAVAETFDVLVEPKADRAFTIFAEALDRSGYGRGTLAPRQGMAAAIPDLRPRPLRTMVDMGMDMGGMDTGGMDMGGMDMGGMDMPAENGGMKGMDAPAGGHPGHMEMAGGGHGAHAAPPGMGEPAPGPVGGMMENAGPVVARHGPDHHGPGNMTVATVERNRLGEPGTGLEDVGHRVLVYTDLVAARPYDQRPPERELELHLTGNMDRYMWSFDGKTFSEVDSPIPFTCGERLRLIMVNDTMMEHPIHLHGMWMQLENGAGELIPRKHTISVKPGERLSVLITADAPGRWAFHCHLLYHMEMGMFRVVEVSPYDGET